VIFLCILLVLYQINAQMAVSGQSSSTLCGSKSSGQCAYDGSTNFVSRSLSFSPTSGKFSGYLITNQCSNKNYGKYAGVQSNVPMSHASCVRQNLPARAYTTLPVAAPIRGVVGYSLSGAADIYGPLDAGFQTGQACDNGLGSCPAGTDIACCEEKLKYECGSSHFRAKMFMDDCGGHADIYHYHFDLVCEYDITAPGHSALIGIALDGRGIYGFDESLNTPPTDLDACGGHFGPVPAIQNVAGIQNAPAAQNVYHYHTQKVPPYTVGCYGPVTSLNQCKSLYRTCSDSFVNITGLDGNYINYDLDCPCYKMGTSTYNQMTPN